jgi:hypothetical protein
MTAPVRLQIRAHGNDVVMDKYAMAHSTTATAAATAFGDAVEGVAAHRPTTAAALEKAFAADPDLIAGHALRGFGGVMLARRETVEAAGTALLDARSASARKGAATPAERVLVEALSDAVAGRIRAAADRLDHHLAATPHNLLFIKLVQSLRFMAGDLVGMRGSMERIVPAWSSATPGYGFVLGCHAFTLEESGAFAAAERVGRAALAHEEKDAWGLHAVAHVFEMDGRPDDGIAWIEGTRATWSACNNFSFHIAWHLALFHLEHDRIDAVLDLYDREVRPVATDDFRDIANAASLLWRLKLSGADVGQRWNELREIARRRADDTTLVFASLHHLLTLVAAGEEACARRLLAALEARAAKPGDQADVAHDVGIAMGRIILSLIDANAMDASRPTAIAERLRRIGGSHAQRDVFIQTLIDITARRGDLATLEGLLQYRARLKRQDALFIWVPTTGGLSRRARRGQHSIAA